MILLSYVSEYIDDAAVIANATSWILFLWTFIRLSETPKNLEQIVDGDGRTDRTSVTVSHTITQKHIPVHRNSPVVADIKPVDIVDIVWDLKAKMHPNRFRLGSASDLVGELTALPRPPSWIWGAYF